MQQACGDAAVDANASGTNVPASANNSRNLAVKRCMLVVRITALSLASIEHNCEYLQDRVVGYFDFLASLSKR
jgi:hypothetical protein